MHTIKPRNILPSCSWLRASITLDVTTCTKYAQQKLESVDEVYHGALAIVQKCNASYTSKGAGSNNHHESMISQYALKSKVAQFCRAIHMLHGPEDFYYYTSMKL